CAHTRTRYVCAIVSDSAMPALVWFRNDLRVDDNAALYNALVGHKKVAAVFYATPAQWRQHDLAAVKGEFIWRSLAALRETLSAMNIPLQVRCVERFVDIDADLRVLATELNCDEVFANREYGINECRRDEAVGHALADADIGWRTFDDATLLPPGSVRTQQGQPFKVYTPFRRALINLIGEGAIGCLSLSAARKTEYWFDAPPLPAYPYTDSQIPAALWPAGEAVAAQRLREFIEQRIGNYRKLRDFPNEHGTSVLSPYLALGVISVRRCVEAALVLTGGQWSGGNEGAATWLNELIWREFYLHVLAQFPRVSMHRPFRSATEAVAWRHHEDDFTAWCEGRT